MAPTSKTRKAVKTWEPATWPRRDLKNSISITALNPIRQFDYVLDPGMTEKELRVKAIQYIKARGKNGRQGQIAVLYYHGKGYMTIQHRDVMGKDAYFCEPGMHLNGFIMGKLSTERNITENGTILDKNWYQMMVAQMKSGKR